MSAAAGQESAITPDMVLMAVRSSAWFGVRSSDLRKKIALTDISIPERTSQRVSIDLVVIRKDDSPSVGMLHFDMAPLAMDLDEPKPLQRGIDFSA